jgi:malate dehydrogenase (oxaloacetate-decarboxylating)
MNARRVTDSMFMAAAKALAGTSPAAHDPEDTLLPAVSRLREVAEVVGNAVAKQAQLDGVAEPRDGDMRDGNKDDRQIAEAVRATMWQPAYQPYRRAIRTRYGE